MYNTLSLEVPSNSYIAVGNDVRGSEQCVVIQPAHEISSFIEENHAYKLGTRDQQHTQRPGPGGASQELMSFWGILFLSQLPTLF